jgi:hypothetical protein
VGRGEVLVVLTLFCWFSQTLMERFSCEETTCVVVSLQFFFMLMAGACVGKHRNDRAVQLIRTSCSLQCAKPCEYTDRSLDTCRLECNGVAPCLNTCEFIKNMKETQAGTYSVWFGSDVTVITGSLQ